MRKAFLIATLSGVLFAVSWPTYGVPLGLFGAFVPLFFLEQDFLKNNNRRGGVRFFALVYWAFLLFNFCTTWWLYLATPFGMFFAVFVNAFLMTVVFAWYHFIARKTSFYTGKIIFICLWLCFEKCHLHWDFSWGWLNLGNAFSHFTDWVQWYEYTGTFGGTLWVLLVNVLFFTVLKNGFTTSRIFFRVCLPLVIFALPLVFSYFLPFKKKTIGYQNVLLLQPNIDPYEKKYKMSNAQMAQKMMNLANTALDSTVQCVIAPETFFPNTIYFQHFEGSFLYDRLKKYAQNNKIDLLFGATFMRVFPSEIPRNKTAISFSNNPKFWFNAYNTACFIAADTTKTFENYYKSKLVVGVEQIPYRNFIGKIMTNTLDLGGELFTLTPQKNRSVFYCQKTPIAPIICYESTYGAFVTDYIKKGAQILTVITNDGWWGNTEGHRQHLALSRLRAIETRRAVVRAANTGISAYIDARGRIVSKLTYDTQGILKVKAPLYEGQTFYVRYGDFIPKIAFLVLLLIVPTSFLKRKVL